MFPVHKLEGSLCICYTVQIPTPTYDSARIRERVVCHAIGLAMGGVPRRTWAVQP